MNEPAALFLRLDRAIPVWNDELSSAMIELGAFLHRLKLRMDKQAETDALVQAVVDAAEDFVAVAYDQVLDIRPLLAKERLEAALEALDPEEAEDD